MLFDVVLSIYSSMHTKAEESSVFTQSWRGCLPACARFRCVCVRFRCVRVLQMCACASDVCVCFRCVCARASDVCACFRCVCARASDVCACFRCVCARASDVCVRALQMCVCALQMCVCALQMCVCARSSVRGKLLTQRATVTPTIPSVLYAHLVPSGSPYIKSWYVRLNENARVGGNT